ncbi:MAG: hypothetical protein ACYC8V_04825 [Caulobacteraceae bacterium]
MARTILILFVAVGLTACASVRTRVALWLHPRPHQAVAERTSGRAPKLAQGLWAIFDPGCGKPSGANLRAWPRCASPFWIGRDFALVVRTRPGRNGAAPDHSYRADFRLAAGDPLIAEVGNEKDGHLFLAFTSLTRDGQGQLVAATGAAFACPSPPTGQITLSPSESGCEAADPDRIREAAQATLHDPDALTRVAWIASGAPQL